MGELIVGRNNPIMTMNIDTTHTGFSSGDPSPISLFPPDEKRFLTPYQEQRLSSTRARKNLRNVLRRANSPNFSTFIISLVKSIEVCLGYHICARITFMLSDVCLDHFAEAYNGTYSAAVGTLLEVIVKNLAIRLRTQTMPYWVFSRVVKAPFSFGRALENFKIDGAGHCSDDDIKIVTDFFG